ncbi:MAG: tRNA (5-methylaminomethyl-2-thiouridine)(34)-methyltransferase MnmD [Bacteroidales bacterium]|nr:tRNA (5-methylaminomethyl-2-thiouridine)(34)-methyltransferase MnmD [Bacteroidales bacterium]
MDYRVFITDDGSTSVIDTAVGDTFHSKYGAISESLYIYIGQGLHYVLPEKKELRILEVGFGAALNAFLTYRESLKSMAHIFYFAVEPNPLPPEIYNHLNYPEMAGVDNGKEIFEIMHGCVPGVETSLTPAFILKKEHCGIEAASLADEFFDLVYFDAFGPAFHPGIWSSDVFRKIFYSMKPGGILVTFSSGGQVRRNLVKAGFQTVKLPGPSGKREITRAARPV